MPPPSTRPSPCRQPTGTQSDHMRALGEPTPCTRYRSTATRTHTHRCGRALCVLPARTTLGERRHARVGIEVCPLSSERIYALNTFFCYRLRNLLCTLVERNRSMSVHNGGVIALQRPAGSGAVVFVGVQDEIRAQQVPVASITTTTTTICRAAVRTGSTDRCRQSTLPKHHHRHMSRSTS